MVQIVVRALDRVERRVPAEYQVGEARLQDVGRPGQCLVELASDHVVVHRAEADRDGALEGAGRRELDQVADIGEGRAVGADGPGPGGHHRHPEHALLVGGAGIDRTVGRNDRQRRSGDAPSSSCASARSPPRSAPPPPRPGSSARRRRRQHQGRHPWR